MTPDQKRLLAGALELVSRGAESLLAKHGQHDQSSHGRGGKKPPKEGQGEEGKPKEESKPKKPPKGDGERNPDWPSTFVDEFGPSTDIMVQNLRDGATGAEYKGYLMRLMTEDKDRGRAYGEALIAQLEKKEGRDFFDRVASSIHKVNYDTAAGEAPNYKFKPIKEVEAIAIALNSKAKSGGDVVKTSKKTLGLDDNDEKAIVQAKEMKKFVSSTKPKSKNVVFQAANRLSQAKMKHTSSSKPSPNKPASNKPQSSSQAPIFDPIGALRDIFKEIL